MMHNSTVAKTLFLIGLITIQTLSQAQIQHVTTEVFKAGIDSEKVQLLDVRTLEEFNAGHLEGAVQIDFYNENFATNILILDKSKPVYIYCGSGSRSLKASKILIETGFTSVIDMAGGYKRWLLANYPVVL